MNFYGKFSALLGLAVLLGCAQETSPTGGIKDEIPPEPVLIVPEPLTTHFNGSSFEYVFDEYIQVDDFSGQLLVSPPLSKKPEYRMRGRKLSVSWESRLLENTTYQFNFGDAIKDFNEGNVNDRLIYVFSTGDYIDSMSVTGRVFDAYTNEPLDKVRVMLYKQLNDSMPYSSPPDYLAISNAQGYFRASYLPLDTFMLFALKEESSNYNYNGPPERIGFLDYHVLSAYDDTAYAHTVAVFEERDTSQYLKAGAGKDYGYYETVFNLPANDPKIRFIDEENDVLLETASLLSKGRDTLRSWVKILEYPELEEITVIVSDEPAFADTSSWYIETEEKYREKAKIQVSASGGSGRIDFNKPFTFAFNHPLEEADTTLIFLLEDSVAVNPSRARLGPFQRKLDVIYPFNKNSAYAIYAKAGAFKDIYGNYSDSVHFQFGLHPDDYYGTLKVNVMLKDTVKTGTFFIELLNEKGTRIETRKITTSQTINFGKLPPGKVKLEGIFDENEDGEWNTGIYNEGIQPERKTYFSDEINIRSNWDADVDWIPSTPFDEN